jgi:phosphate/sulfate permease
VADLSTLHLTLLIVALILACGFEFVNGFHDTANAVATVIYTRSLKPTTAVFLSGIFNFLGVIVGGTAVAMGIMKLLPLELLVKNDLTLSLAMVFALLSSAILWNLGTWYLGLPASSSHTLIGAILGIGLAHAYVSGNDLASGVNITKVTEIGLALIISPLFGFLVSGLLLMISKVLFRHSQIHEAPTQGKKPPLLARTLLILTSSGVSFSHGSNDGQKGMGLIMLILISVLPAQFALSPDVNVNEVKKIQANITTILETNFKNALIEAEKPAKSSQWRIEIIGTAHAQALNAEERTENSITVSEQAVPEKLELRSQILKLDQKISKIEKQNPEVTKSAVWPEVKKQLKKLKSFTEFVPVWVVMMVAFSLGLGTMIGWKRVAVTIGERIGKSHLTYAQGVSAQFVAMSTIGLSAFAGLPVSTTHVLSSGIAGTMAASRSGLQSKTVKHILLAWTLTLPATIVLSFTLFITFLKLVN